MESDSEWQDVKNAAISVIGAGNLLAMGGSAQDELLLAQEAEWQEFNSQMIEAAREVIAAVDEKDEEALFTIGNDKLYPPCESCHQQYQTR